MYKGKVREQWVRKNYNMEDKNLKRTKNQGNKAIKDCYYICDIDK